MPSARRRWLTWTVALIGLAGLVFSGMAIVRQVLPRTFSPQQQRLLDAWVVAGRWRALPKAKIFPAQITYYLPGSGISSYGALRLDAERLMIAPLAPCAQADGATPQLATRLSQAHCQVLLRATYSDETAAMVVTVGVAVLHSPADAARTARFLTGGSGVPGQVAVHPVLGTVAVADSPAAKFGPRQRQLSWVVNEGPYLVVATAGFADGRPRQQVNSDAYVYLEMTSLAQGIATAVARPLGSQPSAPHCPGAPSC